MNMMVLFVESASIISSHSLCPEETITKSRSVLENNSSSVMCNLLLMYKKNLGGCD
jgi:hypothetical protein